MKESIKQEIERIVEDEYGWLSRHEDGFLVYEMEADYRDEMDNETAIKILRSVDPAMEFEELLFDCYSDQRRVYEDELSDRVIDKLGDVLSEEEYSELDDREVYEYVKECIDFDLPRDHFLDQEFCVNIMLDTGDGNFDYTLNSVYPHWASEPGLAHDDKASVVWLAKQQGYNKIQFRKAMDKGDYGNSKCFLESMRCEIVNLPSQMATLTFLAKMTLRDLIELNELIRLQDRDGVYYDATKKPYCGYIVIDKTAETGLYDPWNGGGSMFEIELEKDVRVPVRFIRSALPDGGDGYSVSGVYCMCCSSWRDTVKKIHAPAKL